MKLSIIIVFYNGWQHLTDCLASIPKDPRIADLIVVDNASEEDRSDDLRLQFPNVKWIRNPKNVGYGAAANVGVRASKGDLLLILNQDIQLQGSTLQNLIKAAEANERIAILGAQLMNEDGSRQGSAGPFPTFGNWICRLLIPKAERKYYKKTPAPGKEVAWVTGAFMAIRRSSYEILKGFDEGYFMYYEDVDFCQRAAQSGLRTAIPEDVKAVHSAPIAEKNKVDDDLAIEIRKSQLRYFQKHRPHWEYATLVLITRFYFMLKGWKFHKP